MERSSFVVVLALLFLACGEGTNLGASKDDAGTTTPDDDDAGTMAPPDPMDSGTNTPPPPPPPPPDPIDAGTPINNTDAGTPPPACTTATLAPGDHLFMLEHNGLDREYELHVPPGYDAATATPLVLYFHPLGTTRRYLTRVGTTEKSDAEGFLAAYPGGRRGSWNGGACCGPANGVGLGDEVDDVGFVRAIVAHIQSIACVDDTRIYASGFSNGGFLSHRLACEASDLIAAIAPVSSVNGLPGGSCAPARPVPVLSINGTTDTLVPYAGGFGFPGVTDGEFVSVATSFAAWATANGCTDTATVSFENGSARCETHSACAAAVEVTQCTITGGGHCWFGEPVCALGANSSDLIATDATWSFLSRFRKP